MSFADDVELLQIVARSEQPKQGLSDWVKEKPVRRCRLLVWFADRMSTNEGMDEIVTALVGSTHLRDMPEGLVTLDLMRECIAKWDAQGRKVEP